MVSQVGRVEDDEHTKIVGGFCSLPGRVWISGLRVEGLYVPSVKVRLTNAEILLRESDYRRSGMAESDRPSSSVSESSAGRKTKRKKQRRF